MNFETDRPLYATLRGLVATLIVVAPLFAGLQGAIWFFEWYWARLGAVPKPFVLPLLVGSCIMGAEWLWVRWLERTWLAWWVIDFQLLFETWEYRSDRDG